MKVDNYVAIGIALVIAAAIVAVPFLVIASVIFLIVFLVMTMADAIGEERLKGAPLWLLIVVGLAIGLISSIPASAIVWLVFRIKELT